MGKAAFRYNPLFATRLCERIAQGQTLKQALTSMAPRSPSFTVCISWLHDKSEFREKYEQARQIQADVHADQMLELSQDVLNNPRAATAYKVAIEVLKWQAEVRNKARYGKNIEEAGKNKPLDPIKLRAEIARLETELGVAESKVVPIKAVK